MRQELKAALGLLITALAVAMKLSAFLGAEFAAIFNNSLVSVGLLVLMALGLFIFAYYSLPENLTKNSPEPQLITSITPPDTS